jgi:hypothetical protein
MKMISRDEVLAQVLSLPAADQDAGEAPPGSQKPSEFACPCETMRPMRTCGFSASTVCLNLPESGKQFEIAMINRTGVSV